MGEEFTTDRTPEISVSAAGTGPLERIDIYRGLELIHEAQVFPGRAGNRVRVTWTGASRMSSYSGIVWDGRIKVNGSGITDVKALRFDSPRSRWNLTGDGEIRFHSWNCGYTSGLEIELEDPDAAEITVSFESSLIIGEKFGMHGEAGPRRMALSEADAGTVTLRVKDMGDEPVVLDMGHLNRKFSIERCPEPGPPDYSLTITDDRPKPGVNAYWARVTQLDQEVAWLSPVFVDYAG
jgi:hypothetical protein